MESIFNSIKNLAQNIIDGICNILKTLFIPDENYFNDKIQPLFDLLYSKFPFIEQVKNMFSSFISAIGSSGSTVPEFTFTYKCSTYNIFDFSVFDAYRSTVHSIILFVSYFFFIKKTMKKLPSLIGGI